MNSKTKSILFLSMLLASFSFQSNFALANFGISPPSIANKDLVPGSSYGQDVYLLQSSPDVSLNVTAEVDAGAINAWVKIVNGNSFVIPKGVKQFPMKVIVSVPLDAKLGSYKGKINLKTSPIGAKKDGVSINLGADVSIDVVVSSIKVSNFSIQNFEISDFTKGSMANLVMKVKNDGNVDNGPTKVSLSFFDQYHTKQLGQMEVLINEKVKSFETKDISATFANNLELGSYWADVKIYSDDKVVVDSKLTFNVISGQPKTGDNNQSIPLTSGLTWLYSLVFIVVILGVWFFLKKGKS
jgi:LPXTG-motif cell wall-anchored protein